MNTLKRELTFWDLVANGMVFIGPASIIGIFGMLYAKSGGAVGLVYIIATVMMSFTALSYVEMSAVVPKAGSIFSYASESFGKNIGFFNGWMLLLDYFFIPAVAYLFSGIAFHALITSISAWIFTLLAVGITLTFNLFGAKKVSLFNRVVLFGICIVLAVIIIEGLIIVFQGNSISPVAHSFYMPKQMSSHAIFSAVSIAVLSFLGFDAIATYAEEQKNGKNHIKKAMIFCLVFSGTLFIIESVIGCALAIHSASYYQIHPELQGTLYYDIVKDYY